MKYGIVATVVGLVCLIGCTRTTVSPAGDAQSLVRRAVTQAERGDDRGAIAELDRAIRLRPSHAEAIYLRGAAHDRLGDHTAALRDYDAALRFDPSLVPAYVARAAIHTTLGNKAAADADYESARRLVGDDQVHH